MIQQGVALATLLCTLYRATLALSYVAKGEGSLYTQLKVRILRPGKIISTNQRLANFMLKAVEKLVNKT